MGGIGLFVVGFVREFSVLHQRRLSKNIVRSLLRYFSLFYFDFQGGFGRARFQLPHDYLFWAACTGMMSRCKAKRF